MGHNSMGAARPAAARNKLLAETPAELPPKAKGGNVVSF